MKYVIVLMICLSSLFFTGCYYDVEAELYGSGTCDTTNVNYSGTVTAILNSYGCVTCHSGGAPSGGVNLSHYNGVRGKVTDNRLMGAITHSPGFSPMPQGSNKMSACDINKIKAWIDAGAPNN